MKPPEDEDEVAITCPNCNSLKVTVCENSQGYYQVTSCYDCGYKKECEF